MPVTETSRIPSKTFASSPNFTFIGNVNLGHDLPLPLLGKHYDAIVFAYGASKDRKIGLQGEDKAHIYSARAFVGWYNGLPEYRDLKPDLQAGDTAVVVGQGNVALDVARTLLSKIDHLRKTDITEYALDTLATSKIKHVHVVGRRGPMQAAFTIKELRELLQLEDVNFKSVPDDLFPPDLSELPRPRRRLMELLKKGSPPKENAIKSWSLDFLLAPKSLDWVETDTNKLGGIHFSRTTLQTPADPDSKVTTTDITQFYSHFNPVSLDRLQGRSDSGHGFHRSRLRQTERHDPARWPRQNPTPPAHRHYGPESKPILLRLGKARPHGRHREHHDRRIPNSRSHRRGLAEEDFRSE